LGTDTDGTTLPGDVGFARGIERKAAPFVGRRSLLRPAARDPGRLQLVGLVPVDGQTLLPVGGQIAPNPPPTLSEGHVTSSHLSPELAMPIALAMLKARLASAPDGCLVDLSGGLEVLRLTGEPLADLLCRLGGTASVPRPGEALRSRLADVPVVALSVRPGEAMLLVDRAYAEH